MGSVKIPYYSTRKAWPGSRETWGYWIPKLLAQNPKTGKSAPTLMAKLGFKTIVCGADGPAAWAVAESWNAKWKEARRAHRAGESVTKPGTVEKVYPAGSLGEAFTRFRAMGAYRAKSAGTRTEWEDVWRRRIDPTFGDVDPQTVSAEDVDLWYWGDQDGKIKGLLEKIGVRESYRAVKIWRALWKAISSLKRADGTAYCAAEKDPSFSIRRKTPKGRTAIWTEGEAVRLIKAAWRAGFRGLAAALAVAWDTGLSPVDVRTLTGAQMKGDAEGPFFHRDRTKTGEGAIGTLSRRTHALLKAYMATLPPNLLPSAPIFYTRGSAAGPKGGRPRKPAPYTKDQFGDDFRDLRVTVFGESERGKQGRKIMDFRRSGAVEMLAGGVTPEVMAGKMANTIDQNKELQATYLPHNAAVVRLADAGRLKGRQRMRGEAKS